MPISIRVTHRLFLASLSAVYVRADWQEGAVSETHNTVTPGIGQRTAFQGSYRVPCAQKNTSVGSWATRIGVRAVLVHVGTNEMHEPVGHLQVCTCL